MNEDITVDLLNKNLEKLFQLNKDATGLIFKISEYNPRCWHIFFNSQFKNIERGIISCREELQEIDDEILLRTFLGLNTSNHIISGRMSVLLNTRNVVLSSIGEAQKQLSNINSQIFFQVTVLLSALAIFTSFISFLYK